jgi:hypothetical protein
MVEVSTKYSAPQTHELQMDITPFKSPINGAIINSRSQLRDHMKRHDVVFADDYKEHAAKKAREREERIKGTHPEVRAERVRFISDAFERVRNERIAKGTWRR